MGNPIVTVKEGKLKGVIGKLYDGSSYYSFKGIRYAQAPVGKLRFKAPLPPKPWQGIYDATKHGPVCPQFDLIKKVYIEGSEDCLFLNIYTKSLNPESKLAVMVHFHFGAFITGSGNSNTWGPDYLLQHDVVLVTMNYRLEVLGFLCLDTSEVPGNAGMKDQVAALRWIKDNINQFSGDPNNVTIFGSSSGGASVTYHMFSPMSKGLFHKAISLGGVCIQEWARDVDARGRRKAFILGKHLGKETDDVNELLEFLQDIPAIRFANMTESTMTDDEKYSSLGIHFVPVVEKKFDNVESFMSEDSMDMLLANKVSHVPLIIGYNTGEGIIRMNEKLRIMHIFKEHIHYLVPRNLINRLSREKAMELGKRMRNYYIGDKVISKEDAEAFSVMEADRYFVYNIYRFLCFYSSLSKPVYFYKFSCETDLNILKKAMKLPYLKGACHADESFYIMSNDLTEKMYKEQAELREIVYRVTKLLTNFAKIGNPTPDDSLGVRWRPFTKTSNEYLNIDKRFAMKRNEEMDRIEFWNKMYCDAGLPYISSSRL